MTKAGARRYRLLGVGFLLWPFVCLVGLKLAEPLVHNPSELTIVILGFLILSIPSSLLGHWYIVRRAVSEARIASSGERQMAVRSLLIPFASISVLWRVTEPFLESEAL